MVVDLPGEFRLLMTPIFNLGKDSFRLSMEESLLFRKLPGPAINTSANNENDNNAIKKILLLLCILARV